MVLFHMLWLARPAQFCFLLLLCGFIQSYCVSGLALVLHVAVAAAVVNATKGGHALVNVTAVLAAVNVQGVTKEITLTTGWEWNDNEEWGS